MKVLLTFIVSIFLSTSNLCLSSESNPKSYNASMSDQSVQTLFNTLINNQSETVLNNYSTVYFSHLNDNFPINSHGTCSYVGISMLLSFFDSYWDDEFIATDFEQTTTFSSTITTNQNIDIPSFDTESPGVISEDWDDVSGLSLSQYQNFVLTNEENYLQSYLIKLGYDMFDRYCFDDATNPYGMTLYEQTHLTLYYLTYKRNLCNSQAFVTYATDYDQDALEEYIISRLQDGVPVMINTLTSVGYHSVVAYDYDSSNGTIYVHTGWKDTSGNALTHVSLSQLGVTLSSIESAVSIDIAGGSHGYHCPNYVSSTNLSYCSCQMAFPRNIQMTSGNYMDINPSFKWDSLYEEKWYNFDSYNTYNPYIEFSILSHNQVLIFSKNIYSGTEYTLTDEEWHNLNIIDPYDDYYVRIKLCSNTYNFSNNYFLRCFTKPIDYLADEPITITPTDYTGYTDAYATDYNTRYNFSTHTTSEGYIFKTKRFRAGYIHNECIVLSPKRLGYQEAFIEYQFIVPVDRIDIELSHWRETTTEGLTSTTGKAVIEVFRYGNYNTNQPVLDLLSATTNLPEDRNNKTMYKLCFARPITRFRIYASTYDQNVNDNNRGRICVGNIRLFENRGYLNHGEYVNIQTSGSEINYNPAIWNNDEETREINNCYSYALNYLTDSHINPGESGCGYYSRVHDTSNGLLTYLTESNIFNMVTYDSYPNILSTYGFEFSRVEKYENVQAGSYRVMLAFDLESSIHDYHWYRQNPDGSWSHKPAEGEVRDFDFDGNPIFDPQFCNRKSSACIIAEMNNDAPDFNYSTFVGFYSVRWRTQAE